MVGVVGWRHDLANGTRSKNHRLSDSCWITGHNTNLFLKMGLVLVLRYSARNFSPSFKQPFTFSNSQESR